MKKIFIIILSIMLIGQPIITSAAIPDDEKPFEFEKNSKYDKPKLTVVPKKPIPPPKSPLAPAGPLAIIMALGSMTPYGQEMINRGGQAVEDFDMFIWNELGGKEVINFVQDGFINVTDDLGNWISDAIGTHHMNNDLIIYPDYASLYPELLHVSSTYGIAGPMFFLKRTYDTTISEGNVMYYRMNGLVTSLTAPNNWAGRFRGASYRLDYGSMSNPAPVDTLRFPNTDKGLTDATSYIKEPMNWIRESIIENDWTTSWTFVSPEEYFLNEPDDWRYPLENSELMRRALNKNKPFPLKETVKVPDIPTHLPDLTHEHFPDLNSKPELEDISIVEIDGTKFFEINIRNPYFNPNYPVDPVTNPEHLPYYSPIEVPDGVTTPIWEPGAIPNPNPEWNPETLPETEPNPEPNTPGEPGIIGSPGEPPNPNSINFDKFKRSIAGVTTIFPFSLPWDAGRAFDAIFSGFGSEKPEWELPIFTEVFTISIPNMIYDWIPFIHAFIIITFDIGMIYAIRQWFGGAT